jgi:hypothetical protein
LIIFGYFRKMIQSGAIPPLCDLLNSHEYRIVGLCLEALNTFLEIGIKYFPEIDVNEILLSSGGLNQIDNLQNHNIEAISSLAVRLRDKFDSKPDSDEFMRLMT